MPPRGPRARTRRALLDAALKLLAQGATPSVAEVAEAAEVSRATAYRYYPSQSALIAAVVDESLGPILAWRSTLKTAAGRIDDLLTSAYPRILEHEVPLRAALMLSLQQKANAQRADGSVEPPLVRGHRKETLRHTLEPLRATLDAASVDRAAQALSLVYGTETLVVLKDIWGLDSAQATEVARWTAGAIVAQAERDARAATKKAAAKPRKKS
ncbi:TetR family transcriptional regulator [Alcaligenaceae bacterium B3P038]|nr:TetR family transcriptional regulator [Alcaligenaceae bacterium B3P038]